MYVHMDAKCMTSIMCNIKSKMIKQKEREKKRYTKIYTNSFYYELHPII